MLVGIAVLLELHIHTDILDILVHVIQHIGRRHIMYINHRFMWLLYTLNRFMLPPHTVHHVIPDIHIHSQLNIVLVVIFIVTIHTEVIMITIQVDTISKIVGLHLITNSHVSSITTIVSHSQTTNSQHLPIHKGIGIETRDLVDNVSSYKKS